LCSIFKYYFNTRAYNKRNDIYLGSHDSATFDLDTEGGRAGDFSEDIGMPDEKMEKWFKTQQMYFTEQLNNGIRYFDLRIIKRSDTGGIHFVHGLHSYIYFMPRPDMFIHSTGP
jgi:uncharacterized protein YutD